MVLHMNDASLPHSVSTNTYGDSSLLTFLIPPELFIPVQNLRVGATLGGGASGIVKAGTYGATQVAIKHIPMMGIESEANSTFVRECKIISRLHHPQVATFFGFTYTADWFMLVQELCSGGDLRGAFQKHPVEARKNAHRYVAEISSAMEHLHQINVVHRDMKPENILLSSTDINAAVCKVCDFGCSKIVDEPIGTAMTKGLGTVHYLAPELLERMQQKEPHPEGTDIKEIDGFKTDVFACAIVFAECFQPEYVLYEGMASFAIMTSVLEDSSFRPPIPEDLPAEEAKLIQQMWDKDPAERPTFAEIVAKWGGIMDDMDVIK